MSHLCGWIERIPGGTRQNDGLETGIRGATAARVAWPLSVLRPRPDSAAQCRADLRRLSSGMASRGTTASVGLGECPRRVRGPRRRERCASEQRSSCSADAFAAQPPPFRTATARSPGRALRHVEQRCSRYLGATGTAAELRARRRRPRPEGAGHGAEGLRAADGQQLADLGHHMWQSWYEKGPLSTRQA